MYVIRPGRIVEASLIGVALVMAGVLLGKPFDDSSLRHWLLFSKPQLSLILPIYAAVASILPVWVLLCPRGYLSSYMKVGVIARAGGGDSRCPSDVENARRHALRRRRRAGRARHGLAVRLHRHHVRGCPGFHALVGSGTTPKMIDRESDIRPIAYGGMLLEGFVSIAALVAACSLEPGDYFKINIRPGEIRRRRRRSKDEPRPRPVRHAQFDELERGPARRIWRAGSAGRSPWPSAWPRSSADLPGMKRLERLLVPFRHHVRGAVHPHAAGDRHAGVPLHRAGGGGALRRRRRPTGGSRTGAGTSPPASPSAFSGDICSTRAASKTSGG